MMKKFLIILSLILTLVYPSLSHTQDDIIRFLPYGNNENWYVGIALGVENWSCLASSELETGSKITFLKSFDMRYFVIISLVNGVPDLDKDTSQKIVLISFDNNNSFREKISEVLDPNSLAIELTEEEVLLMVANETASIFFEDSPQKYSENMVLTGFQDASSILEMCFTESKEFVNQFK